MIDLRKLHEETNSIHGENIFDKIFKTLVFSKKMCNVVLTISDCVVCLNTTPLAFQPMLLCELFSIFSVPFLTHVKHRTFQAVTLKIHLIHLQQSSCYYQQSFNYLSSFRSTKRDYIQKSLPAEKDWKEYSPDFYGSTPKHPLETHALNVCCLLLAVLWYL